MKLFKPQWLALKVYFFVILVGTLILMLPISNMNNQWGDILISLFTSTSATCVTGLNIVNISEHYTFFGQIVILILIQIGGIGVMILGTFFVLLAVGHLSLYNQYLLIDIFRLSGAGSIKPLLIRSIIYTIVIELWGAVILVVRFFYVYNYPFKKAFFYGVFHSASAFCNAGFSLFNDSLAGFRNDIWIVSVISILIFVGGLGMVVLYELACMRPWDRYWRIRNFSLHTRIVLYTSIFLILIGCIIFLISEWSKYPAYKDKIVIALFHSITARTAGFSLIDISRLNPLALFGTIFLMFIGASPASTGGGIKTTTLVIMGATVLNMIKGRNVVVIGSKTIPDKIVREAFVIFWLGFLWICLIFSLLLMIENVKNINTVSISGSDSILFEVVSAFGTVGLSCGITPSLSVAGKILIILTMFTGRLGPLTIATLIGVYNRIYLVKYPEEHVAVG